MLTTTEKGEEQASKKSAALQEAATQMLATMPAMFRTIKQQARNDETHGPWRDLGGTQIWVLHALSKGIQLTSELARGFNVTNPTMTRIVDGLVEKGCVERHNDPHDRRKMYLRITDLGRDTEKQAECYFRASLAAFLSPLSEKQLAEIMRAFAYLQSLLPEENVESVGSCPVKGSLDSSTGQKSNVRPDRKTVK